MSAALNHYDLWGSQLNVTEWFWLSSVVADNTLYINGGELYNRPNIDDSNTEMRTINGTYQIDLTKSWTNVTITGNFIPEPTTQTVRRPMLWYSEASKTLYRYGGWQYGYNDYLYYVWTMQNPNIAATETSNLSWQTLNSGLGSNSFGLGGSGYTSTSSSLYALSGADPSAWGNPYQGLLNFTDSTQSFTNLSSVGATTNGVSMHAGTAFAAFGPAGYLAFVGGTTGEQDPGVTIPGQLIPMSSVSLYSAETQTWYLQPVTGDIPPPRSAFCYASAMSTNQTLELFIYGGNIDPESDTADPNNPGFTSVYVLSVPAFRWFKGPTPLPSDSASIRRAAHHCTVIGNRQMFSVGGLFPSDTSQVLGHYVDPWPNGIGVFDMTAMQWKSQYDPDAPAYESPAMVQEYYATNYTAPAFVNQVLARDFAYSSTNNKTSHSQTGAIVGGVIGGITVLVIIVVGLLCLRRRRRLRSVANESRRSSRWRSIPLEKSTYSDAEPPPSELEVRLPELEVRPLELGS